MITAREPKHRRTRDQLKHHGSKNTRGISMCHACSEPPGESQFKDIKHHGSKKAPGESQIRVFRSIMGISLCHACSEPPGTKSSTRGANQHQTKRRGPHQAPRTKGPNQVPRIQSKHQGNHNVSTVFRTTRESQCVNRAAPARAR